MDLHLPPEKCCSYSFPSALKRSARLLIGAIVRCRYRNSFGGAHLGFIGRRRSHAPVPLLLKARCVLILLAPLFRLQSFPALHGSSFARPPRSPSPFTTPQHPFERGACGPQPQLIPASLEPHPLCAHSSAHPVTARAAAQRPVARRQWSILRS
jgi:hypothetical protein